MEKMQSVDKAKLCARIIRERKAIDPVLFNVSELTTITDYFLIASGNSSRQVQAITRHLQKRMREEGFRPLGIEGEREGHWVLMDYGDVVIQLFYKPVREFYDLESLWIEAPRINFEDGDLQDAKE
ncbi:MAG TPA: ribosome silencing factor [Desulfobacteraceae bacterium]|jgi:ribosome-associated protein|nr:ribosome silencing factor [Desulfobacteraceae bacterium]HPQ27350.1 ribosome silencing factor [Desulfobacteraceae bacterium]